MRPFTEMTRRLLKERRVTGFHMQFPATVAKLDEWMAMKFAFDHKTARKGDHQEMEWADWLVDSLFPRRLYIENGETLKALLRDKRIYDIAGFSGNWNNSFGRMARPRPEVPEGFVNFMLERWRGKYRGMPQYFFDVESPEWVCAPLSGRPDIPKTGRTAVSCVMLYGFHWLDNQAHISIILRHLNWSHGWGDIFGAEAALRAVCKELRLPEEAIGNVTIFANSASMDEDVIAKRYLTEVSGEL